jgi:hypothetical protein
MRPGVMFVTLVGGMVVLAVACEERFPAPLGVGAPSPASSSPVDAAVTDAAPGDLDAAALVDAAADAPPPGACNVRVAAPPIADSPHVSDGTAIAYASNPPSSGPHYNAWANFQEFDHPVADGNLVHALEHGGVLLLYKCSEDAGACADLLAQLRAVRAAVPTDPLCSEGIRTRVILAPRPDNATAVSAAAWGHTYEADCVDAPSLAAFIAAHYAKAPENFCFPGSIF